MSALECLLSTARQRRYTSSTGFAVPFVHELPVEPTDAPFLATNSRGGLVKTSCRKNGEVWTAFCEVDLEAEGKFLGGIVTELFKISEQNRWPNRFFSIPDALTWMADNGYRPEYLVFPWSKVHKFTKTELKKEDGQRLMMAQGYIVEVDKIKVLAADLPEDRILVTSTPGLVGFYCRSDFHLALLFQQADRAISLVNTEFHDLAG